MAHAPCLDHVVGIINYLALSRISTRIRRRVRILRDSSSTCVDSAIQAMEKDMLLNPFREWFLVQGHFEHTIREFLIRVRDSKGTDDEAVQQHEMGLVRSIEDEFENAGLIIEHAIAEGDEKNLESVQSELLQKAEMFVTRIRNIHDLNPSLISSTSSTSSDNRSMGEVTCLEHFSDPINWLPFGLSIRMRRHYRIQKDPNSTSLDSAIQLIENDLGDVSDGYSLKCNLDAIKEFINFAKDWSGADDAARQHLEEVVSSIDYQFETVGHDILYALRTGDDQRLDVVLSILRNKITLFQARTKEATDFCGPRRYIRKEEDAYSTLLDSTLDILSSKYGLVYGYEVPWEAVTKGLEMIQIFSVFVPQWRANDIKGVGKLLGDVVSCIEGEFKTTEVEIEKAIKSGDGERLDGVRRKLVDKIERLKPRIGKAYEFLSDYAFETTIPVIADSRVWYMLLRCLSCCHIKGTINRDFSDILSALDSLGELYLPFDPKPLSAIGFLIQGVGICLARLMFLRWSGEMHREYGIIMASDLLQRIKPTSPEILCMYMDDLINLKVASHRNMHHLLDLILPPSKTSLKTIQGLLDSLLKYWIDSYSNQPEDHLKLLRLDIEKLICDAACVSYSCIMAAGDDDDMLCQLLQRALLLNLELVLVQLVTGFDRSKISFESISKGLSLAQTFLHSPQDVYLERLVLIFTHIEQISRQAQSLSLQEECETLKFQKLLLDFKLMKIQAFLMEQIKCCPDLIHLVKDQVHAIDDGVKMLLKYLSDSPLSEELILSCIERVAAEETPVYYCFRSNQDKQQFSNEMSVFVLSLLEKVNALNSEILDMDLLRSRGSLVFTSPRMSHQGVGFLDILFQKLEGILANNADSIGYTMKHQIEAVLEELGPLRSFWVKLAEKSNAELEDLRASVVQAAYGADYLIDWILLVNRDWSHMSRLSNIIDKMKILNSQLSKFDPMKNDSAQVSSASHASEHMIITQTTSPDVGEAGISLKDEEDIVIGQLIGGTSMKLEAVTILGMPGIGKTTLARKVYNHPQVKQHFYKIAWCCVSQVYRKRELLFEILSHVTKSTGDMSTKTDEELLDMMYQGLKGQRYLVVMDDVWGTQAWDELKSAFSDDENGSKILFTTRNEEVGLKAPHSSDPHTLRFFNDKESWTLLKEKVFGKDECPKDLLEIGMEIAKGCRGLPMSIIAIAGILKTPEKDIEFWKKIEKDLKSHILKSPDIQCLHILELSYHHLPDDLKPCLLYFAAFGEDSEVTVQKLIHIWIAEGFVRETHLKSPEVVAESYVMNLIGRSLLMAAKKRSGGRVKTCKVHDMVYNLCSRKAEEENFLQHINGYDNLFSSSQLDYGVDLKYRPVAKIYHQRRLSICSKRKQFVMLKPSGPSVRTLLFSATSDTYPRCPYEEISFITEEFKILSVLDIETINVGSSFPKGMELLYPLRYLAISGDIRFVPSSVAKLWNLETFMVKGLMGKVALPGTIWSMSKLRHLHVSSQATFRLQGKSDVESSSKLNNMASLSCPALSDGDNSVEMMKLFPNVQKLKCTFSGPSQNSKKIIQFPTLDFLVDLDSLKVIYYGSQEIYCQLKGVSFPMNLKKLSLSNFRFTWDDFSAIGELPGLKILSLKSIDFNSPEWEMNDEEFKKLEYLKLDSLKIVEWNVESEPLPNLRQLVLRSCDQLEEVPSSFGEIPTLQMIDMKWCSASSGNSVVEIQNKKLEYGYNEFVAFVNGMVPKS